MFFSKVLQNSTIRLCVACIPQGLDHFGNLDICPFMYKTNNFKEGIPPRRTPVKLILNGKKTKRDSRQT